MKGSILKSKPICGFIVVGLLISSLPAPLAAQAKSFAPTMMTKKEIDQQITKLKKAIKKIQATKIALPAVIAGFGIPLTVLAAASGVGAIILLLPTTWPAGGAWMTAVAAIIYLLAAGALSSSIIGLETIGLTISTFLGLSAASILATLVSVKKLEKIEKQQPGILSTEQKTTIAQFKNLTKGPLWRAVIKGLKLRQELNKIAQSAILENKDLTSKIAAKKKNPQTIIKKYIKIRWQLTNLDKTIIEFNKKRAELKAARDKHKKLTPAYHVANTKLIAFNMNPKFLAIKLQKKKFEKQIKNLKQKYGSFAGLNNAVQQFMQKAKTIVQELKKPV